jgi:hypothetical protein
MNVIVRCDGKQVAAFIGKGLVRTETLRHLNILAVVLLMNYKDVHNIFISETLVNGTRHVSRIEAAEMRPWEHRRYGARVKLRNEDFRTELKAVGQVYKTFNI